MLPSIQFSFKISDRIIDENSSHLKDKFEYSRKIINEINAKKYSEVLPPFDNLPEDFPEITITGFDNPSPGFIFMAPYSLYPSVSYSYLIIMDNNGVPVYYLRVPGLQLILKCNTTAH